MHRLEAEKWLLQPKNPNGAFLIRTSDGTQNSLFLSLRDNCTVRHYKIQQLDDCSYYINNKQTFCTIQNLVAHYKKDADGLAHRLSDPCICLNQPVTMSLSDKDKWKIDQNSLKFDRKLEMGNFSEVYLGLWNNHTPVAIKTPKPGTMEVAEFMAEAYFMKKMHHPKLLQLYGVCTLQEESIFIVTELMEHGALLNYLQKGDGKNLKLPQLIDMAAQIADGMAYLEEHSCIHRDLAARNIWVGEGCVCKIANFSLARVIKKDIYNALDGTKFPTKWTAPEAALYNRFSIKSDIWSFGILIWELLTEGAMPYSGMNNHKVLECVEQGYRMPSPKNCPDALYNIMLSCWEHKPDNRPTFEYLRNQLKDYSCSSI